jgi:hypothetical protein
MPNTFERSRKEKLKELLDTMDASEHVQILAIVRAKTDQLTQTQNGVLVSTDNLDDKCLSEIESYAFFMRDQRKRMEEDAKARKTYERQVQNG